MKNLALALGVSLVFFFILPTEGEAALFRSLKIGDAGEDVRELQEFLNIDPDTRVAAYGVGSPGNETDYFGRLTHAAVVRFQEKYKSDVLFPVGLSSGSGFVGAMTRAKIIALRAGVSNVNTASGGQSTTPISQTVPIAPTTSTLNTSPSQNVGVSPAPINPYVNSVPVSIISINPALVKDGDMVTIKGTGFTATKNMVEIGTGLISKTFSDLPSPDGKTITFLFDAPFVEPMSLVALEALPFDAREDLETQLQAAGGSLKDIAYPYRGIKNEAELSAALAQNGKSIRSLDEIFHVTVSNTNGVATNDALLLRAARKLSFGPTFSDRMKDFFEPIAMKVSPFAEEANAQATLPGGGFHTTIITYCTCGGGHLSLLTPFAGAGGLTWFPPGFVPITGTVFPGAFYLGWLSIGLGQCFIYAGVTCIDIVGALPTIYGQSI